MHGVGPGTVLGGRYAVTLRTSEAPSHERWRANDHTLEREVVLVCFPASSPIAAATLDAARRAAGIEDPRLVRVLDVGTDQGVAFVVEEPLTGAVPLSHLLQSGGLPADEVRRLTGEAASALDKASHRGLHHLALTPSSVLRMPDGAVKVRGLATEAVLTDADRLSDEHASRADAVGLVKVAYAGLTARWPAVAVDGGLVGPGRVGHRPRGRADDRRRRRRALRDRRRRAQRPRPHLPDDARRQPARPDLARRPRPADRAVALRAAAVRRCQRHRPARLAGSSRGRRGSCRSWAPPAAGGAAGVAAVPVPPRLHRGHPRGRPRPASAATSFCRRPRLPRAALVLRRSRWGQLPAAQAVRPGSPRRGRQPRVPLLPSATGSAPSPVPPPTRPPPEPPSAAPRTPRTRRDDYDGEEIGLTDALDEAPETEIEPPLPVFGRDGPERPTGAQSRIALAIVGVLVLVALFIGINNVAKIGQRDGTRPPTPS